MGFLSKYSATEKLDLDDGFYVEVRKFLSAAQRASAEKKLMATQVVQKKGSAKGELVSRLDTSEFRLELAVQSVADWNLTDENDRPLPLHPVDSLRQSMNRLPTTVVDQIIAIVDREGKEEEADSAEEAQFSGEADAGDQE